MKKQNNWIFPTLTILTLLLIAGLFYYGGTQGWFQANINIDQSFDSQLQNPPKTDLTCTLDMSPNNVCVDDPITGKLTAEKNTHCYLFSDWGLGWKPVYDGFTNSNGLWTEIKAIDTIGNYDFRGFCDLDDSKTYTEGDCFTNLENVIVNDCTPDPIPPTYNNGDHVGDEEGNNHMGEGVNVIITPIDLGDLPAMTEDGELGLRATIQTSWNYVTPETCQQLQQVEQMWWRLYDSDTSDGTDWSRIDTQPVALGEETGCNLAWDGQTEWMFTAQKLLEVYDCVIEYEYDIDVYVCEK